MNRTQRVLVLLLVIQVALLGLFALRRGDRAGAEPRALFPDLDALTPSRVRIDTEEGDSVTLNRDGDVWSLADPAGYPALSSAVDDLLEKLKGLQVRRAVVRSNRYHTTLRVADDDFVRRLRVWGDDEDDPAIDLFLGSSPNFDVAHVRIADEDPVYDLRGLGTFDLRAEPSAWVDRDFLDVPAEDVVGLSLHNDHGTIELSRDDGSWAVLSPSLPGGRGLDPAKVDALVRSICSVRLAAPAGRVDSGGMGLEDPAAVLELRYRPGRPGDDALPLATSTGLVEPPDHASAPDRDDGGTEAAEAGDGEASAPIVSVRILVGANVDANDAEGRRYASRSGGRFGVVLDGHDSAKFTDQRISDLLAAVE
jgi:hypothetical protein